jgi:hypothetical protein
MGGTFYGMETLSHNFINIWPFIMNILEKAKENNIKETI